MNTRDDEESAIEEDEKNTFLGRLYGPRLVLIVWLTLILALAIVVGARAVEMLRNGGDNIITVPGDYPNIQAAINAASPGAIIQVRAGVYNENLVINKPISLVAESFDQVDPTHNTTIVDGGSGTTTILISEALAPMPVIRGFIIQNGADGILAYSEFISEFNYIHSSNNLTSYQKSGGGINRNNVYFNARDNALRLDNLDRPLLIENNRIMYSVHDGIEISLPGASAPPVVTVIDIRNNMILGNGEDGIQFVDHPDNPQDTNRRYLITGNLIANNQKAGIGFMPSANTVEDYSGAALAEAVRVFNNTFYGNNYGISGGGNLVTFNNIIANSLNRGAWKVEGLPGSNAVVAYSLFHNNLVDAEQSVLGTGVILGVDPLFVAAPNPGPDGTWSTVDDDFTGLLLRPDSPAIDKGVTQYVANNGEVVPPVPITGFTGTAPDLGWREVGAPIFLTPLPTSIFSPTPFPTMTTVIFTSTPTATAIVLSPTPLPPTFTFTPVASPPTATLTTIPPTTSPAVTLTPTRTPLTIQSINPIAAQANTTVIVTITGTGFQNGAVVTFEGGQGLPQEVTAVQVVNPTTITATVNVKNDGSLGTQVWDVRVTNPDFSTTVLLDAFTVIP